MEIRQLRTFRVVAGLLSFNKAAARLNYAQSSISAQIQALEDDLHVKLFDRLGRNILLTEAGERLLRYAEKILDLADESRVELRGRAEPEGFLTIRIPESFGVHRLPPIIKRFRDRFPKVKLELIACAHEGLQEDLRKGITDLAFLFAESVSAVDLEAELLGFESIVLVGYPDHPLAKRKIVRTSDLEGQRILLSRTDCSYRRVFEKILEDEKVQVDTSMVFYSVAVLKRCVMEGAGLTILPEVAVQEEIANGKLVPFPWEEAPLETAILMVRYKGRWVSPTLNAFMVMTKEVLCSG
jgi:DNA-binding transcriptional LysR family regulator